MEHDYTIVRLNCTCAAIELTQALNLWEKSGYELISLNIVRDVQFVAVLRKPHGKPEFPERRGPRGELLL